MLRQTYTPLYPLFLEGNYKRLKWLNTKISLRRLCNGYSSRRYKGFDGYHVLIIACNNRNYIRTFLERNVRVNFKPGLFFGRCNLIGFVIDLVVVYEDISMFYAYIIFYNGS